jgi:lycopene cyclase domain-containing protein
MKHLTYLAVLALVAAGAGWLEVVVRTRVLRRWRRLLLTLGPVVLAFSLWDVHAIAQGWWWFDPALVTGVTLPGGVPLEELAFFVVVPTAALLSFEAVRAVRGWDVGEDTR